MKVCRICGEKYHAKGLCKSCYNKERNQIPEMKEKNRLYAKEWNQRLEVKKSISFF